MAPARATAYNGGAYNQGTIFCFHPYVPTLRALSPSTLDAGGPDITLHLKGSGFLSGSTVQWNGTSLATHYVSATALTALVPASLTASRGILFLACCSHNVGEAEFAEAARRGIGDAGRNGCILKVSGAGPDHPVHPALPETAYLKAMTFALD